MNGNNAISYSELDTFAHCPKDYELRYILGLQRKRRDENLHQGSQIHLLLQTANLNPELDPFDAVEAQRRELAGVIESNMELFSEEKEEQLAMLTDSVRIVDGYLNRTLDERKTEEILHVEETFVLKMQNGRVHSCTPDVVVMRPDGSVTVRDYKSTGKTPSFTTPSANLQIIMNFAAVQALYPEATQFQFDRLRKKVPTQPRLNKTGPRKVNNLNAIDTTYEILLDFLENEAPDLMDDPEHRQRLAQLRDEDRFYYRETFFPSAAWIENGLQDIEALSDSLTRAVETKRFPRVYHSSGMRACDRCAMEPVCRAQLLDWNVQAVIDEQYEPRDTSYREYETEDE